MQTQDVVVPVGAGLMKSYLALPDTVEPRPAVIVLQEIFGVNAEMRRITELLASAGYVALAINYYHRSDPDLDVPYDEAGMQRGFAAAKQTSRATYREDLGAAITWLNQRSDVASGRIATWGFCMGGSVAFYSATLPGVKAAVSFYGGSIASPFGSGEPAALTDSAAVQAPLLLAFGGRDHYISAAQIEQIESTLQQAGKVFELVVYPEQDHGFFRQSSKAFGTPDVADAWQRVQGFLERV